MENRFSLGLIASLVKRRALYFAVPFAAVAALGIGATMSLPAMYESKATILVESQQIPSELVKSTVTALATERLQVIQQKVMTRDNLLGLAEKYGLFSKRKDLSKSDLVDLIRERIVIAQSALDQSARRKKQDNRVVTAFSVGYHDESPEITTKVANEIVTLILDEDAKTRTASAAETSKFLEREASRVAEELTKVEAAIAEFKLKNTNALPEKLQFNMALLERTEKNAEQTEHDIRVVEEERRLAVFEANVKFAQNGTLVSDDGRLAIEKRIAVVQSDLASKAAIYAEAHPEMRVLRKELKALQQQLAAFEKTAVSANETIEPAVGTEQSLTREKIKTLDDRKAFLVQQRDNYRKAAESLKAIIVQTPEVGSNLTVMERRLESLQRNLDETNAKVSQARLGERLEENQQAERFEVIELPILPTEPYSPDRFKLAALSLVAAFAAGGGISYAAEALDSTVRSAADLTAKFGRPPLGTVGYIPTRRETRARRWKLLFAVLAGLVLAICGLAAVHFLYMPLDLLAFKLMSKISR